MKIYSLDIGGSSIKHAIVDTDLDYSQLSQIRSTYKFSSNSFDDLRFIVVNLVREMHTANPEIDKIAISTTGGVDDQGIVLNAGHFQGYSNISWEKILLKEIPQIKRVFTFNDGKASAWAEYLSIDPKPKCFVHFVVGTGVGGAVIINKAIYTGEHGFAGYLGHIKVGESNVKCSCGKHGCVETFASAPAIIRLYLKKLTMDNNYKSPSIQELISQLNLGDENAMNAFTMAGMYLGVAISNIMNILNPGAITIGGGVMVGFEKTGRNIYFESAKKTAMELAHKRVETNVHIKIAKFGNDGGLLGAALLAERYLEP